MNLHKKGSANMWWIIIGAVMALVVMIVLMMLFTGKSNKLEIGLIDCENKGGDCSIGDADVCKSMGGTVSYIFDCNNGNSCCFTGEKNKGESCTKNSECNSGICESNGISEVCQ